MKKLLKILAIPLIVIAITLTVISCIIQNPKPEECEVIQIKISHISEGGVKDIVFHNEAKDKFYYINRGLEQGLNLDSLNEKVLNKTVTLHLAKVLGGRTTNHIAQLALENEVIYTEFK